MRPLGSLSKVPTGLLVGAATIATLAVTAASASVASATHVVDLWADLAADEVVSEPGPEGATGHVHLKLFVPAGEACYELTADWMDAIDQPISESTLAVHVGEKGIDGDRLLSGFTEPATPRMSPWRCLKGITSRVLTGIAQDPDGHYIVVTTAEFPNGAVRGQLDDEPPENAHPSRDRTPSVPDTRTTISQSPDPWSLLAIAAALLSVLGVVRITRRRGRGNW